MGLFGMLQAERWASVETLVKAGPDAPTLCTGWNTKDLAAHLLLQEQGNGVPMLLTAPLGLAAFRAGLRAPSVLAEKMQVRQDALSSRTSWTRMLDQLRNGPPRAIAIPKFADLRLHENWIHHEDVRRAGDDMSPRPPTAEVDDALWGALHLLAPYQRKVIGSTALVLRRDDGGEIVIGSSNDKVFATGAAGELALLLSGRGRVANVLLEGNESAIERYRMSPALAL